MRLELEKLAASRKDTFSEMYEVVRTIEVVMDDEKYRVEIVKGVEDGGVYYDARYLVNRELILQPKPTPTKRADCRNRKRCACG